MKKQKAMALIFGGMFLLQLAGSGSVPGAVCRAETAETGNTVTDGTADLYDGVQAVQAVYPEPVAADIDAETFLMSSAHWDWWQSTREKINASAASQDVMERYYELLQKELLVTEEDENVVCSPLNIYIALSMLAEVSEGSTRAQILDVLQADDPEMLRSRTKALWEANYLDTPVIKCMLADSIWLRDDISYNEDTLERLAENYYASSFRGTMGSKEMDAAYAKWTDDNTKGLLSEYTRDMQLDPRTVLGLVSTIYYKAAWNEKFREERTDTAVFHGAAGDTQVPMMHRDEMMALYRTDSFRAVAISLSDGGAMYFYLPEEEVNVKDLAASPEVIRICRGEYDLEAGYPIVHLSVPKFEISKKTDLLDVLKNLGITDAADPDTADFSPLTDEMERIWLNKAEHAALVSIDEQGVTGAAYTDLAMCGAGMPQEEIDLLLDRPFYFAITGRDGSLLFSGIVQNIEE